MRYLYLVLALMLLSVLFPSVALAATPDAGNTSLDQGHGNDWHFVITGLNSPSNAPDIIHIKWATGERDLPLDSYSEGIAHYYLTGLALPVGDWPFSGTADINQAGWNGKLNLIHSPSSPLTRMPVSAALGFGLAGLGTFFYIERRALVIRPVYNARSCR